MNEEEKKAYVVEARARLKKAIGEKLAGIRALIADEISRMAECGGADAAESILCASRSFATVKLLPSLLSVTNFPTPA